MSENYLCISIPEELQQFKKISRILEENNEPEQPTVNFDFGVKLVKDEQGNPAHAEYYSDTGELLKKIYYHGSAVSRIEHYRNNRLYSEEEYIDGKLDQEKTFNNLRELIATIKYKYAPKGRLMSISKLIKDDRYDVDYGYDELGRVNKRTIKQNSNPLDEQKYRLDIMDRIVEYRDRNQMIRVHQINHNNDLVSYTITDKAGNSIAVINKFLCSDYIGSEVDVNGHKTTLKDRCYVDNEMLKRPSATKDDLNFILARLFKQLKREKTPDIKTKRIEKQAILEKIIGDNITAPMKILPISMRKLQLICNK